TTTSSIDVDVLASTNPTGLALGAPDNVGATSNTLLSVVVKPGKYPTSTGINVGANLSAIGGLASQAFLDDGQNGDAVAGDGIYSFSAQIGVGTQTGPLNIPVSVVDGLNRQTNAMLTLNITNQNSLAASGNAPT